MASLRSEIRYEWTQLKHDEPGRRFRNHRERMMHGSRVLAMARAILGVLLLVAGVVLLFMPGPGLLVIVFGFALLAGMSCRLAAVMDRAEPGIRRLAHRGKQRWDALSMAGKVALVALVGAAAAAALYGMYRVWFG